ncbi:MAG: hypothetical protein ACK56J_17855 [Planctomycetota bacterium]
MSRKILPASLVGRRSREFALVPAFLFAQRMNVVLRDLVPPYEERWGVAH